MKQLILLFFILFLVSCSNLEGAVVQTVVKDSGSIAVYFCPTDDCSGVLVDFLDSALESIDCALFDIGLESVQKKLLEKASEIEVRVITDDGYLEKFDYSFVTGDKSGFMHNKFCVIDGEKLFTGSMNPTSNGAYKNNNNLLLIESPVLAANYLAEFEEMWNGVFKKGDRVLNPVVLLEDIMVENYFCPEDFCAERIKEELEKASESIYFMAFSFTHNGIANVLLLKNLEGVTVKGVFESRGSEMWYSKFKVLEHQMDVVKDVNPNTMHHKVFVVDGKTVITGSMNPTASGDEKNDENVLIIHDTKIASRFLEEFGRVYED